MPGRWGVLGLPGWLHQGPEQPRAVLYRADGGQRHLQGTVDITYEMKARLLVRGGMSLMLRC